MNFDIPLYIEFTSDGSILEFVVEKKGVFTYKYVKLQKNSTLKIGSFINWKEEHLWSAMMSQFSVCYYKKSDVALKCKMDPVVANGAKGFTKKELKIAAEEEVLKRKEYATKPEPVKPGRKGKKKIDIQTKLF